MAKYLLEMFAVSLLLTLVLELAVAWCMGLQKGREIQLVILVNILTNPAAVLLCWLGLPQLPVEVTVVAVEALVYICFAKDKKWNIPRPVRLAVLANGISWSAGLLIQWIGGRL